MATQAIRNVFYCTLVVATYFTLLYFGIIGKISEKYVLFGVIHEMITIPMMVGILFAFLFSLYQLFVKKNKSFYSLITIGVISCSLIIFIVNSFLNV
jgi:hypothetical protein